MSLTTSRTIVGTSMYSAWVLISPSTITRPVVVAVSQATRAYWSWRMNASRIASLTWSHILSGWPSVTDSDVNRYCAASTMLNGGLPRVRTPGRVSLCGSGPGPEGLEVQVALDQAQRLVIDHRVVTQPDDRLALGHEQRGADGPMVE